MLFKKINDNNLKVNVKIIDDLRKIMNNEEMKDSSKLNKVSNIVNRMVEAFQDVPDRPEKKLSTYQEFMKKNYPRFREEMVGQQGNDPDPKDVMKFGAQQWKLNKNKMM